jgi:hypothetical protein
MTKKCSVSDPSPSKRIIIQFKFINLANQQPQSQLQKQHELHTVYTSKSRKENNQGMKDMKGQNTDIKDKTYNIKH